VIYLSIYIYIILPVPWLQHLLPFPVCTQLNSTPRRVPVRPSYSFIKPSSEERYDLASLRRHFAGTHDAAHRVNIEYTPLLDPLSCPHRTIRSYDPPLASAPARQHESMVCIVHVCRLPSLKSPGCKLVVAVPRVEPACHTSAVYAISRLPALVCGRVVPATQRLAVELETRTSTRLGRGVNATRRAWAMRSRACGIFSRSDGGRWSASDCRCCTTLHCCSIVAQ
jgi:hypothetical protein